jgi:hypothetical protein
VDLAKLNELEKAYLTRRGEMDCQIRDLRKTLEAEAATLKNAKPRTTIVLLIDDLDRCDPTDMIDLLESLKLFLYVENIITVLAVDKDVIDRGVEAKYGKFEFFKDRQERARQGIPRENDSDSGLPVPVACRPGARFYQSSRPIG